MRLRPRDDVDVQDRLARSAAETAGVWMSTPEVAGWLARRAGAHRFRVERIPFALLDGWSFGPGGNLAHRSGRFFSVEGLHIVAGEDPVPEWRQPIIVQPEIGILGILAKEFNGVLHFLMQAKMEPGNPRLVQLSPTVQATRSNYTRVHGGAPVRYLDYFTGQERGQERAQERGRVLVDVLQSEHGSWFFRKSNRNMIVETRDNVEVGDDFCWLTLGQIGRLLRRDNVVNMDARTVLACAPAAPPEAGAALSDTELVSWFTAERSRHEVRTRLVPLDEVSGWTTGEWSIDHERDRYFRVIAVSAEAGSREVHRWTQPLFEPLGAGVAAFLVRRFGGVPHLLVRARVEGGFLGTVELGPTVQCTPESYVHLPVSRRPRFLATVLGADPGRIRYEAVHAEEGGRFYRAQSRYLLVDADERTAAADPPPGFMWVTPGQLNSLARHSHYVNVQARTLLAVLNSRAAEL